MVDLRVLCEDGYGEPRNLAAAAAHYRQAMELDDADAAGPIANLSRDGRGVPKDLRESRRLSENAIELGSVIVRAALAALLYQM
jgi:TPR repeat protein